MAETRYRRYIKQIMRLPILAYQRLCRPFIPSCCRFYPSCSDYALEALARYSVRKSLWLISKRLLRCQPLAKGGLDPLP